MHETMGLSGMCGLCILGNPYMYILGGHEPVGLILLYMHLVNSHCCVAVVVYELSRFPVWRWGPSNSMILIHVYMLICDWIWKKTLHKGFTHYLHNTRALGNHPVLPSTTAIILIAKICS